MSHFYVAYGVLTIDGVHDKNPQITKQFVTFYAAYFVNGAAQSAQTHTNMPHNNNNTSDCKNR